MKKDEPTKQKKQDIKLESEGAKFLGHLLIEGVSAYKAYINFPGYDLTASIYKQIN